MLQSQHCHLAVLADTFEAVEQNIVMVAQVPGHLGMHCFDFDWELDFDVGLDLDLMVSGFLILVVNDMLILTLDLISIVS